MKTNALPSALFQSHHFEAEVKQEYASNMLQSQEKVMVLDDFLKPEVLKGIQSFLAQEAVFEQKYRIYSVPKYIDKEQWNSASQEDRFYTFRSVKTVKDEYKTSPNWLKYLSLKMAFSKTAVMDYFTQITGLEASRCQEVYAKCMSKDDFIKPHDDADGKRKICCVLFTSDQIDKSMGGQLCFTNSDTGQEIKIDPICNRLVVFEASAANSHIVSPLKTSDKNLTRDNVVIWYE